MASFKPREIVRILEKLGYIRKRQTGSHLIQTKAVLRNYIGTILQQMSENNLTSFEGNIPTPLNHASVFPLTVCDGTISITGVDSLVEYAMVECGNGCANKTVVVNQKGEKRISTQAWFDIDFEEIDLDSDFRDKIDPVDLMIPRLPTGMTSEEFHGIEQKIRRAFSSADMFFPTNEDPEGKAYPPL